MARKTVSMHIVLTEASREQLDRLARLEHVYRSTLIARAVNLLDARIKVVEARQQREGQR